MIREPLFRVHARCPLASRPGEEIHQVSVPMPWTDANMKLMEWLMVVKGPGWKITIEDAADE